MLEGILEGLLFVVGDDGISFEEIKHVLEIEDEELTELLNKYEKTLENDSRGLKLISYGKYKLTTKEEHKSYYQKLINIEDSSILTQASLETLAIVAYNQPITRSQLDEIRGMDSSYILRKLVSKNLVKDIGRSELPGRPKLYQVTGDFLDYFGINGIEELPKIEEVVSESEEVNLYNSKYSEQ